MCARRVPAMRAVRTQLDSRTRTSRTAEHARHTGRVGEELRAVPPTCGRWTRILLQDTGVTSTHRPDMGQPRGNWAHTDAGTSIGIRRDDNEVLLACTGGFCSAIVRFAWSRHIRA